MTMKPTRLYYPLSKPPARDRRARARPYIIFIYILCVILYLYNIYVKCLKEYLKENNLKKIEDLLKKIEDLLKKNLKEHLKEEIIN